MTTALLGGIIGLLLWTAFAGAHGKDTAVVTRQLWALTFLGVIACLLLPSWPQRLLLMGVLVNVHRVPQPSNHKGFLEGVLIVVAGYLLLTPYVTPVWIDAVLWTLSVIGALLGAQTVFTIYYVLSHNHHLHPLNIKKQLFMYHFVESWGPFTFQLSEVRLTPGGFTCGQLMPNWLHAMACLATAATCGLTLTGHGWAWALMPLVLLPILVGIPCRLTRWLRSAGPINQCFLHLVVLAGALLWVISPWAGFNWFLCLTASIIAIILHRYRANFPKAIDSGRLEEWFALLKYWVLLKSKDVYLFGHGIRSWIVLSSSRSQLRVTQDPTVSGNYFSMAHNEYVQQLFEYGVVGLVALLWYLGDIVVSAYAHHKGLFLVYATMASIAAISFPWAFYHTIRTEGRDNKTQQVVWMKNDNYGSVFLFWCSFVLAVIAP